MGIYQSCCNLGKHRARLCLLLMLGLPISCFHLLLQPEATLFICPMPGQHCSQLCAIVLAWELHLNCLQVTAERLQAFSPQAMRYMEVFKQSWLQSADVIFGPDPFGLSATPESWVAIKCKQYNAFHISYPVSPTEAVKLKSNQPKNSS